LENGQLHPDLTHAIQQKSQIYVICRLGNDSQRAVKYLQSLYDSIKVKDIIGGLEEYALKIDHSFPRY
jgi:adenylyltransferase/sulfurtransferase